MQRYIGIDISKRYFDLHCLLEDKQRQFENNQKGIRQYLKLLANLRAKLASMESTSGYETALACEPQVAGFTILKAF